MRRNFHAIIRVFVFALAATVVPAPALACKPEPLPLCERPSLFAFDPVSHEELLRSVQEFQSLLTTKIAASDRHRRNINLRSSCFDNQFALFYLSAVKAAALESRNRTCSAQLQLVTKNVDRLLSASTDEWQSVHDIRATKELEQAAKKVRASLLAFHKAHRQL